MADIESNIRVGFDTSNALASIKNLQREISAFHTSIAKGSAAAATATANLQKDLLNTINSTGQFAASMTRVRSSAESFTNALEKNKLSMGEYFRFAGGASKNFSKSFSREFDIINKVARERVKDLQTQYISLGRDASGALQAIKIRPMILDLQDAGTQMQIAAQRQQIFNQLLKQGSTNLLNFGKNTQWAGRQLMVGFTIPLSIFGNMAAKTFMDLEKQVIRFRRVYGDAFSTAFETEQAVKNVQALAAEFTKYGVAVEKTLELAADAAQMGLKGAELSAQISNATRLAVLGEVSQQEALQATISVTDAFGVAATDLASKIDFLNAVENESVTAISDLTVAIPKAGPVVRQLGGSVEDLAFFLTAMKEGGINASEGANALKSGLASLINPTEKASEFLKGFGINIQNIVNANKGDVKGIVIEFARALDQLDPTARARAIEQLFGKFQFSRLSTLFQNVIAEGNQAQRVLELAGSSTSELAAISERELGNIASSSTFKFQKAIEDLKLAIAPVGEQFLKAVTPIIEFGTNMLTEFNKLNDGVKNFVVVGGAVLAGLGPIFLMTFGLIANGVANIIKGFAAVRGWFLKTKDSSTVLGEQLDYLSQEQLQAAAIASSLEQAHATLEQRFTSEAFAVENLVRAYEKAIKAQAAFSGLPRINRGTSQQPTGYNSGVVSVPGPKGKGDIVPAMLTPGEAVIPAEMAKKYAPLIQGMIAGNIPGFNRGVFLGMPRSGKSTQKNREAADQIYEMFLQSSYRDIAPTEYGHQLAQTSGHSFPIFGLGGVYMGPGGKKVFVKPVMDEKAALAEMRGTEIARRAHGLEAPKQRIVVIRDPQDIKRQRKFLALESELDARFVNNQPTAVFNEEQYFRQLVASLVRVDKDLATGNLFGNVVADVGPAGVFSRASGIRDYAADLPSMEQQAMVNLLGVKGGAKRAFAESTVGLMAKMTAEQYHQRMIAEIQRVLPMLRETISSFGLTNPAEVDAYNAMIKRLETGLGVDWRKFHAVHSAVKVSKPKQSTVAGYADGVVSVPGPKGKGDVVPAMLSPGEAVIPADKAKKYASLINAMISGNIPGFANGKKVSIGKIAGEYRQPGGRATERTVNASHVQGMQSSELASTMLKIAAVNEEFADTEIAVDEVVPALDELGKQLTQTKDVVNKATGETKKVTQELFEIIPRNLKVKDLDPAKEYMVQGLAFGGTAIPEKQLRNKDAYQAAGIDAAPFDLNDVVAAGAKAKTALETRTDLEQDVVNQLRILVSEADDAQVLLRGQNAAVADLTYAQGVATKAIEFGINQDPTMGMSAMEAKQAAEERVSRVLRSYEKNVQEGMQQQDALDIAKLELQKEMITAKDNLKFTAFAKGEGREVGRPINTKGPRAIKSGSKRQVVNPDAIKVSRGRDAAQAAALAASVGAESIDQIHEQMILQSQPSAESLSLAKEAGRTGALKFYKALNDGLGISSPSREFENIANNVSAGVRQSTDNAQQAGERIGQTVATAAAIAGTTQAKGFKIPGSRRVTTDPNVYNNAMAAMQSRIQAMGTNMPVNMLGNVEGLGEAYSLATRELVENVNKQRMTFDQLNGKLLGLSFGLSSITGIFSMFGGELGVVGEAFMTLTNSLFALSGITQALISLGIKDLAVKKVRLAADAALGAGEAIFAGNSLGQGFKNLFAVIKQVVTALPKFVKFLGLAGIALSAFLFISDAINKAREAEKKAIEELGDVANMSAEKIDKLGTLLGVKATVSPLEMGASGLSIPQVSSANQLGQVVDLAQSEDFKEQFKDDISALRDATLEEAQLALEALSIRLYSKGFEKDNIDLIIKALQAQAGQTDVSLDFKKLGIDTGNINYDQIISEINTNLQNAFENGPEYKFLPNITLAPADPNNQNVGLVQRMRVTRELTTEQQAQINTAAATTASALNALSSDLRDNKINVDQFNQSFSALINTLSTSADPKAALQALFAEINPELYVDDVIALNDQLAILQALTAGVDVQPFMQAIVDGTNTKDQTKIDAKNKALEDMAIAASKATKGLAELQNTLDLGDIDSEIETNKKVAAALDTLETAGMSASDAYDALTDSRWQGIMLSAIENGTLTETIAKYKEWKDAIDAVSDAKPDEPITFQDALEAVEENIIGTENQVSAYNKLIDQGYPAAKALELIGDQALVTAINLAATEQDWTWVDYLIQRADAANNILNPKTPTKSPFQEATESLREQIKEIKNANTAYQKLRSAGFSVAQAFTAAKDPTIATALATTKIGTEKWKQLVQLIRQYNALQSKATLSELIRQNAAATADESRINRIQAGLAKLGLTADQVGTVIEQIGQEPELLKQFANDLKNGKINSKQIADYLRGVKNLDVKVKIAVTKEEVDAKADEAFSMINEAFSAKKALIEIDFEQGTNLSGENDDLINMGAINETIKKSEKFIQERNDKISDNEFLLEGIQEQEDAINKKYDERLEALDAAAEANERIANQQKSQLSISSALATGDIARAADLIQQQREEEAQKQLELRRAAIEKSREQELANTRASDGRTRAQIEADIKRLKGEIRQEEIKNLKPAQDLLDAANDTLDSVTKSVTVLGQNEAAWKAIEANARAARVEAQAYEKAIFNALKSGKVDTLGKKIDNPEVDELNRQRAVNRKKYQQATDPAEKKRLFDLNVKLGKDILKLGGTPLRNGGFVSGPGTATSDSIPAWLSNGEYVINAQTVKMLGSGFFDNLNQNKFASGGVVSGSGRSATVSASNGGRSPLLAKFMDFVLGDSIAGALRGDNKISDIKLSDAGMLALGLVPGGSLAKAVKPLSKGAGSSMSLKSMLNTGFSDDSLIKTVNEKLGILRSTEKLVTRSSNPNLAKELLDPANVKPTQGRSLGPGMYFAPNKNVSDRFWGALGGSMYTPKIGPLDAIKLMGSKGYASAQDVSSLGVRIDRGDSVLSPSIQALKEAGYIGYRGNAKPDLSDAFEITNWLVGAKGGLKLKNFNLSDILNTTGKNFAMGGLVKPQYFNSGGMIKGYARGGDVVPMMATPGEFVMSKYAVKTYGADTMKSINSGTYSGDSVYNYEINVNVKTDANVDQIARSVISQIKQIDSQRIRSYRA